MRCVRMNAVGGYGALSVACLLLAAEAWSPGAWGASALAQRAQPARTQPAPTTARRAAGNASGQRRGARRAPGSGRAVAFAQQLGDAFASVAESSAPSVVSIRVEVQRGIARLGRHGRGGYGQGGTVRGGGSGVLFRSDGHILTNNHVVGGARRIEVRLHDGRTFPARVVGTDPATDLAVIKIEEGGLPAARFARRDQIRVGEWVVAVGSPFGLDYTVTAGIVSAMGRGDVGMNEIEDYVQTDASINPGNSGGPLLNLNGEVIGINTMIVGRGTGIGFAVVSELAEQVATQLIESGQVRRAYIGVSFRRMTDFLAGRFGVPAGTQGALVAGVEPGGPAARAGLQSGDVITHVGGQAFSEESELLRQVLAASIGSPLRLRVQRGARSFDVEVVTAERPVRQGRAGGAVPQPAAPNAQTPPNGAGQPHAGNGTPQRGRVGMALEEERRGVRVVQVRSGSLAERSGVRAGDLIVRFAVRGQRGTIRVQRPSALQQAFAHGDVRLGIRRGRAMRWIMIPGTGS